MSQTIKLVECPRDAMQGWPTFIPTDRKIEYLNQLLKVGFDILDFGSFVSPKAIPQLADTHEVVSKLQLNDRTKLLAIIANKRGAEDAIQYDQIHYLGFPFSISETFQQRNTNKSIDEALEDVAHIQNLCVQHHKEAMLYISMGFGNPYNDPYDTDTVFKYFQKLVDIGVTNIALADTIGVSNPDNIKFIFENVIPQFPTINIGAHFHSTAETRIEKLNAAYQAGCRSFDSAILGIGGCPMAKDELVGNMATETVVSWAKQQQILPNIDQEALLKAQMIASSIFNQ